ncbi:MAG TPA: ABC transporter ATP-binding protein [Candidatus Binatia bacterium]
MIGAPFLKVNGLRKKFGKFVAVDDVSFEIPSGEVLTLLGPSGCGKTTTLRIIAGFERPNKGEVEIDGRTIVSAAKNIFLPPEKREMGMVFQSYAIWPHMTVFENVAYPLRLRWTPESRIKEKVGSVLELVGLSGLEQRSAMLLSGGQQQRVALARALVYSPKILLLDEPLSNLDAKLREQMRVELKSLQRRLGITVIFVTHDQVEAMTLSDRLVVMRDGRIEQIGAPRDIYERPETPFVQEFLGRVIWLEGEVVERGWQEVMVALAGDHGARIRCDTADDAMQKGDSVVVAIRPEKVQLEKRCGDGGFNQVPCRVENSIFLGDRYECHLRYGATTFILTTSCEAAFASGDNIHLRLAPESARIWRKDHPNGRSAP